MTIEGIKKQFNKTSAVLHLDIIFKGTPPFGPHFLILSSPLYLLKVVVVQMHRWTVLTSIRSLSFSMLPGGKNTVVLVVTSKLSHKSDWVEQSIQPTLTRPSWRETAPTKQMCCQNSQHTNQSDCFNSSLTVPSILWHLPTFQLISA